MSKYPMNTKVRNTVVNIMLSMRRVKFLAIWGMDIGKNVRISSSAKLDKTNPRGVHIGSDTAISFDVAILTHDFINARHLDTHIGERCMIGARSIIYPGVTIGDECIVGAASVVMSDVPSHSVVSGNPARIVESGIRTGRWGSRNVTQKRAQPARDDRNGVSPSTGNAVTRGRAEIAAIVRGELLDVSPGDYGRPFDELGIDSFRFISLRAAIETQLDVQLPDASWASAATLDDLIDLGSIRSFDSVPVVVASSVVSDRVGAAIDGSNPNGPDANRSDVNRSGATEQRSYRLNMPQMAVGGMSESWLFKEIGDIHWSILAKGLEQESADIVDGEGNRLYATFTRISYVSTLPLKSYRENAPFQMIGKMSRFGAGMFFSKIMFDGDQGKISIDAMSSFSKRSKEGANEKLLRGQPTIPGDCPIAILAERPVELEDYNEKKITLPAEVVFETEYNILPFYEINGAGLLYFAAYPIIHDISCLRFAGNNFYNEFGTLERKVYYYSNSAPNETLIVKIHRWDESHDGINIEASISRKSDGVRMCTIYTKKGRI